MKSLNYKVLRLSILLLLTIVGLSNCDGKNMHSEETQTAFLELIGKENFDDLSLTIYYNVANFLTYDALSAEDLIDYPGTNKVVVGGEQLYDHVDLLNKMASADLIPVEGRSYLNARIYYVFETEEDGNIFDVAMWGAQLDDEGNYIGSCFIVNGVSVEENNAFYDIMKPFLPGDIIEKLGI